MARNRPSFRKATSATLPKPVRNSGISPADSQASSANWPSARVRVLASRRPASGETRPSGKFKLMPASIPLIEAIRWGSRGPVGSAPSPDNRVRRRPRGLFPFGKRKFLLGCFQSLRRPGGANGSQWRTSATFGGQKIWRIANRACGPS